MVRVRVLYSGRVQGVGFRYNAMQRATPYEITGYVRNLPDGRVELVAEGNRQEIDGLLEAVMQSMGDHITDSPCEELAASGEFTRFGIRY